MPFDAAAILTHLEAVTHERARREAAPGLAAQVHAVKDYQQRRFAHTYADLLAIPRYAGAARFFLEELYGPGDFQRRDAQFARVVPTLVRLFPQEVIDTVGHLGELHALSEQLDTRMGERLAGPVVDAASYARAWRATGDSAARERQVELMLVIGRALDRLVGSFVVRQSLRLMRGPAAAAGLGDLQRFLETGLDAFRAMKGAGDFLATVERRELELCTALFVTDPDSAADHAGWERLRAALP
jgi:hypothetical protein